VEIAEGANELVDLAVGDCLEATGATLDLAGALEHHDRKGGQDGDQGRHELCHYRDSLVLRVQADRRIASGLECVFACQHSRSRTVEHRLGRVPP
jgi:hypothetical protein